MKLFKNYKKLYETEKNNCRVYMEQYKETYARNIELQKDIISLKKKLFRLKKELENAKQN